MQNLTLDRVVRDACRAIGTFSMYYVGCYILGRIGWISFDPVLYTMIWIGLRYIIQTWITHFVEGGKSENKNSKN